MRTPDATVTTGTSKSAIINSTDSVAEDTVEALTTVKIAYQPNLFVKVATDTEEVHFNIAAVNSDATVDWDSMEVFRMTVVPDYTVEAGETKEMTVAMNDSGDTAKVDAVKAITTATNIPNPLTSVTLAASPTTPQTAGTAVTLTATATGGANVFYQLVQRMLGAIMVSGLTYFLSRERN